MSVMVYVHAMTGTLLIIEDDSFTDEQIEAKIASLDAHTPGWRGMTYCNGAPMSNTATGMMLTREGTRSIFDDVDD